MPVYEERPFWRTRYADSITTLLNQIPVSFQKVKDFCQKPENLDYVKGFVDAYRAKYITECNRGEKTGTQTLEDTEEALRATHTLSPGGRNAKKTQNLSNAIAFIFHDSLIVEDLHHEFTPKLAREINKLIGEGLFQAAGSYRKKEAKPAGYDHLYVTPGLIGEEMNKLFEETGKRLSEGNYEWFQVASDFLARFLFIHPFPNGNGRTARVLVSVLLIKYTLVPVSLFNVTSSDYTRDQSNEVYLKVLYEAQILDNFHLLNSLIIESTYLSLESFLIHLDVD
ncbi:uncharacterized protein LOC135124175 isoform X1 [Zophobas morio]|uniref:uncharacterized protein LOC135124175 isoform X1 n=1 Tax=Zophobas morio TaxID=2755281 RepID=UPI0030837596